MPPRRTRAKRHNDDDSRSGNAGTPASESAALSSLSSSSGVKTKRARASAETTAAAAVTTGSPKMVSLTTLRGRELAIMSSTRALEFIGEKSVEARIQHTKSLADELTAFFKSDESSPFSQTRGVYLLASLIPLVVGYWSSYVDVYLFDNARLAAAFDVKDTTKHAFGLQVVRECRMRLLCPHFPDLCIPRPISRCVLSDWAIFQRPSVLTHNSVRTSTKLCMHPSGFVDSYLHVRALKGDYTITIKTDGCLDEPSLLRFMQDLTTTADAKLCIIVDPDLSPLRDLPADVSKRIDFVSCRQLLLRWLEIQVILEMLCTEILRSAFKSAPSLVEYIHAEVASVKGMLREKVARARTGTKSMID